MDATERSAEIARLRGVVAAGNPTELVGALPRLGDLLRESGAYGDAASTYLHAAKALREQGFFLKAAASLRHADAATRAAGIVATATDAEWEALFAAIDAHDPQLRAIVSASRTHERGDRDGIAHA